MERAESAAYIIPGVAAEGEPPGRLPVRPVFIEVNPVKKPARKHAVICSTCNVREFCLPGGLEAHDLRRIDDLIYNRRRLKRGEALYQAGSESKAVYAIRSGTFKTSLRVGADGRQQ